MYELTYIANIIEEISEYNMTGKGRYVVLDYGRASGKTTAINIMLRTSSEYRVFYNLYSHKERCPADIRHLAAGVIDMDISLRRTNIFFLDDVFNRTLEIVKNDVESIKSRVEEFDKLVFRIGDRL